MDRKVSLPPEDKRFEYQQNLLLEEPFFLDCIRKFDGKKRGTANGAAAYRVNCPCCNKNIAVMGVARNRGTYLLMCPNETCSVNAKGLVLHQVIKQYLPELFDQWRDAHWIKRERFGWYGIKNRSGRIGLGGTA